MRLQPHEAFELIHRIGGIAVHAHPGALGSDELLMELIEMGLDGLECFHLLHTEAQMRHYFDLSLKHDLLVTGGSDFHGLNREDVNLGKISVTSKVVDDILLNTKTMVEF